MTALALEKEKFYFFVYVGYSLTGKEQKESFLGLGEKLKAEKLRMRELQGPTAYTKRSQVPCFEDVSALLLTCVLVLSNSIFCTPLVPHIHPTQIQQGCLVPSDRASS